MIESMESNFHKIFFMTFTWNVNNDDIQDKVAKDDGVVLFVFSQLY